MLAAATALRFGHVNAGADNRAIVQFAQRQRPSAIVHCRRAANRYQQSPRGRSRVFSNTGKPRRLELGLRLAGTNIAT